MNWLNNRTGYSLIEVTVVAAILSVLVLLVYTQVAWFGATLVRAEVQKLYHVCCHAQRMAQVTHKQQTLTINTATNKYSANNTQESLAACVSYGYLAGALGPPSAPTHPITQKSTFSNNQIIFYPDGIISSGTIYLVDADRTTMYALTSGVAQVSFLRLYRYDHGSWVLLDE